MNQDLLDELAAELLVPPPAPYRLPRRVDEPLEVKRARLTQLDHNLNPERLKHAPVADSLAYLVALRGRVCDLPGAYVDYLLCRVPQTAEARAAQKQINRRVGPVDNRRAA